MVTDGDEVLLMQIGDGEAVQQREPGACAAEEAREVLRVPASRVLDELRPPVAVTGKSVCNPKVDGSERVQAFDEPLPGNIDSQVFGLVQHPQAVLELDQEHRSPVAVRIGKSALDAGDGTSVRHVENVSADGVDVGVQPRDEFARSSAPLSCQRRHQPKQDGLVVEQALESTGRHLGNELVVARRLREPFIQQGCAQGAHVAE